jgi:hypothetical protein
MEQRRELMNKNRDLSDHCRIFSNTDFEEIGRERTTRLPNLTCDPL